MRAWSRIRLRGRAKPDETIITWGYEFAPADSGGTDVTESYELADNRGNRWYWKLAGKRRGRTNAEGMRVTLERLKAVVESSAPGS